MADSETDPFSSEDLATERSAGSSSARATHVHRKETANLGGPLGAYESLASSPRLPDLVAITNRIVSEAAAQRASSWNFTAKVAAAAEEASLARAEAETPFGNALKVLESGPEGEPERALAAALWAHAIAEIARKDEDKAAGDVLWLATHTSFDALPLLDRALGDDASDLWKAIADRVKRIDEGRGGAIGRAEGLVGAAGIAASPETTAIRAELAARVKDGVLLRVLGVAREPGTLRFEGRSVSAPRGPVATTLLALTGILSVIHAARFLGRLVLAYKCPAEVTFTDAGVCVKTRSELLGKVLREREHVIPRAGLVKVIREVRYPSAAFYAGLLALAVGSYVGVRAFSDGVRSASPSLLLAGLVVVVIGVAADFVLGSVLPSSRGLVRVLFVPRSGETLCVADVDARRADDAIRRSFG